MRIVFIALLLVGFIATPLFAELKKSDLEKQVVMTEEATLLGQVDTVCLYLSSAKVSLTPSMAKDNVIAVKMTALSRDLVSNPVKLKSYSLRIINTFKSVLTERLPIYAPAVAGKFDFNRDVSFDIASTAARIPAAEYKNGIWKDVGGKSAIVVSQVATEPESASQPQPETYGEAEQNASPKSKKGCNCPAER